MQRTILQVPLSRELKETAEQAALEQGFSSLQEILRVFMRKLAQKQVDVSLTEEGVIYLSPKAEKRYGKIIRNIKRGREKVYTAKSVHDLMNQLLSHGGN